LLCGVLALAGMVTFAFVSFLGCGKLVCSDFSPILVRLYACSVLGFFPFFLFGIYLQLDKTTVSPILFVSLFFMLFFVFPLYSIIPQFFIARWLAKDVEDGTMQTV